MDLYTTGCTIEPPIVWYIQKCMLIWKICFYFSFVFVICSSKMKTRLDTRHRFTEKVLSRRDNFQLARHTMTELSLLCIVVIRNSLYLANSLDRLYFRQTRSTTFCLFPAIVCERIARVENCPGARAPF